MELEVKERHQYVSMLAQHISSENEAWQTFSEQMMRH